MDETFFFKCESNLQVYQVGPGDLGNQQVPVDRKQRIGKEMYSS